jgi:hypothetical protein
MRIMQKQVRNSRYIEDKLWNNSSEQNPYRKADSRSFYQDIPHLLRKFITMSTATGDWALSSATWIHPFSLRHIFNTLPSKASKVFQVVFSLQPFRLKFCVLCNPHLPCACYNLRPSRPFKFGKLYNIWWCTVYEAPFLCFYPFYRYCLPEGLKIHFRILFLNPLHNIPSLRGQTKSHFSIKGHIKSQPFKSLRL